MTTLAQKIGASHAVVDMSMKAREFVNLARVLALSRGDRFEAQRIVHENRIVCGARIKTILEDHNAAWTFSRDDVLRMKAAVAPGTTTDASWGLPLAEFQTLAGAFLTSLRSYGCFDALLPAMRRVPFRVRVGSVTSGATASIVGQNTYKSVTKLSV